MDTVAHIFVTRSTAEAGDGSHIFPSVPFRVLLFYNTCIESFVTQRMRDYEFALRKREGGERVDEQLKDGLSLVTRIEGSWRRTIGRMLWLGTSVSIFSLKIKPDTGSNDPRARNSDFVMHLVMYQDLNFSSAAFRRFTAHCREIAFSKKSPGVYRDLVVRIPDEVMGRITKGNV